jgi:transposase-like protein
MNESSPSCSGFGVHHQCPVCKSEKLIKSGKTASGKQRYSCKNCQKRFIINYSYSACKPNTNQQIILLIVLQPSILVAPESNRSYAHPSLKKQTISCLNL